MDKERKAGAIDIFSLGVRKEHVGELQINIHEDYRGYGLGNLLMDEALSMSREDLKLRLITLTCFSVNQIALSLYKKHGFKEYGRLPKAINFKKRLIDEILLYKEL